MKYYVGNTIFIFNKHDYINPEGSLHTKIGIYTIISDDREDGVYYTDAPCIDSDTNDSEGWYAEDTQFCYSNIKLINILFGANNAN